MQGYGTHVEGLYRCGRRQRNAVVGRNPRPPSQPIICLRTRMGYSNPPPQCSLEAAPCYLLFMLTCVMLTPSLFHRSVGLRGVTDASYTACGGDAHKCASAMNAVVGNMTAWVRSSRGNSNAPIIWFLFGEAAALMSAGLLVPPTGVDFLAADNYPHIVRAVAARRCCAPMLRAGAVVRLPHFQSPVSFSTFLSPPPFFPPFPLAAPCFF